MATTYTVIASVDNASNRLTNTSAESSEWPIQKSSWRLPDDVILIIADHLHYRWTKLLDVFLPTNNGGTSKFRKYVRKCIGAATVIPTTPPMPRIEVNRDGNIWKISLWGAKLTNSAIGDLLSLPSTLHILDLGWNELTFLDVSILPRGLIRLYLHENLLTELDLTKLPPALQILELKGNKLSRANLTQLPAGLKWLYLNRNELRELQLNVLPLAVEFINLKLNHLHDVDFETLPLDRREKVRLCGKGNQKIDDILTHSAQ